MTAEATPTEATPTRSGQRGARPLQDALRAKAARLAVPLSVGIELTKSCNLRCVHCYLSGKVTELPTGRILRLLDELQSEGTMQVMFTGGELASHPDWLEILKRAKAAGFVVLLATNGTLFSDDDLSAIADLRPGRVSVSVYGGDAPTHDAITRIPGSFDRSVHALRFLTEHGVRTKVSCPLMRRNVQSFRDVFRLVDDIGCEVQFDPNIVPCQDGSDDVLDHRVPADELRSFFLERTILRLSREGKVIQSVDEPERRPMRNCSAGLTGGFIESSGDVYPCMGFPPSFGNLHDETFGRIWHGRLAANHRALMNAPVAECPDCDLNPYCTARCPRLALVEDGAVSGPSKRACELTGLCRELRLSLLDSRTCDINAHAELSDTRGSDPV